MLGPHTQKGRTFAFILWIWKAFYIPHLREIGIIQVGKLNFQKQIIFLAPPWSDQEPDYPQNGVKTTGINICEFIYKLSLYFIFLQGGGEQHLPFGVKSQTIKEQMCHLD